MRLNWKGWSYDLFRSVIRAMGIAGGVWAGYEVKYQEINLNDLWLAILVAGGLRALLGFLAEHPLPDDLDAKPEVKP